MLRATSKRKIINCSSKFPIGLSKTSSFHKTLKINSEVSEDNSLQNSENLSTLPGTPSSSKSYQPRSCRHSVRMKVLYARRTKNPPPFKEKHKAHEEATQCSNSELLTAVSLKAANLPAILVNSEIVEASSSRS